MTHTASGSKPGVPKGWLVPAVALVLILVAAAIGWLSRSIVIDFVAWWPLWLLLGGLAFFGRHMKLGRVRVARARPDPGDRCPRRLPGGTHPGVGGDAIFIGVTGGPGIGIGHRCRDVGADRRQGRCRVGGERVSLHGGPDPDRRQHRTSPSSGADPGHRDRDRPRARGRPGLVHLCRLEPRARPRAELEHFARWDHRGRSLHTEVDRIAGRGEWERDSRTGRARRHRSGSPETSRSRFRPGLPARVVGEAVVPEDWTQTSDGWTSPAGGGGWVISVSEGATLEIITA